MRIVKYIVFLRKKALKLEKLDFNGKREKSIIKREIRAFLCFLVSFFIVWVGLKQGIPSETEYYIFTILSIFIGLFITAIVFYLGVLATSSNEKLSQNISLYIKEETKEDRDLKISITDINIPTALDELQKKQKKNHGLQSIYILGYNVIICVLTVFILFVYHLLSSHLNIDLSIYTVSDEITLSSIMAFGKVTSIYLLRFLIIYGVINVMYNTLYVISSLIVVNTSSK